ncbi:MAG: hypothetical protein NC821_06610, partial [Candidatus Omnitrophica bacterium]|nr:hypothetical protein [Candidatus Omnitrophota bacterium]
WWMHLGKVEAFVLGGQGLISSQPGYIEAQLVLDQAEQIDPAYVRAITGVANYHGANVKETQVEKALREKMSPELIVRLANIALLHQRGSIDPVINQPVPLTIEFKDKTAKEAIVRGLARQQEYEMKNGLGGLRLGEEIDERTISAQSIGSLGIADLIILLTRQDTAPYVVKVSLKK